MDPENIYAIPGFREPVSSFTHLLAAPVFLILGVFLVRRAGHSWMGRISLSVLVFASVFLLSMSGIYHLLWWGSTKSVMLHLDVAAVFTLIAGTATPVHAILFRGVHRWLPIIFVWGAAITGIVLRTSLGEDFPPSVGTVLFLILGWSGLYPCMLLWRRYGYPFVEPLIWGGVAYSIGALIVLAHWPTIVPGIIGAHELWHVAVLTGLGFHWRFVFQFASGLP
jgi:channel protein (hemolysin III family)